MPMNESDWDEFLKRLTEATKRAVRDFAAQHPSEEICYFAYDSEPRYGYVLLSFNTTQESLRHAQKWHDRHAERRRELLANPTWFDNAYYQVKAHSVMPFCDNTGDFKYQGFSEVRFPEWEAFAASPDYPAPKDDDDDYLANRVARLFSRAIDQLVEDGAFGALRLASPTLLGFGFHDEDMLILRFIGLPTAAQPGAPPNGGPATPFGNPGVPEGPPSVS
jgi:hypothetical protein